MKKLLVLIFLLINTVSFAQEITKEYWDNLFNSCKKWEEKIEYSGNQENHILWFDNGNEDEYLLAYYTLQVIFGEQYDKQLLADKQVYVFEGNNYYSMIPNKYMRDSKYLVKYWCENCYDPNLELIKLRYITKKKISN